MGFDELMIDVEKKRDLDAYRRYEDEYNGRDRIPLDGEYFNFLKRRKDVVVIIVVLAVLLVISTYYDSFGRLNYASISGDLNGLTEYENDDIAFYSSVDFELVEDENGIEYFAHEDYKFTVQYYSYDDLGEKITEPYVKGGFPKSAYLIGGEADVFSWTDENPDYPNGVVSHEDEGVVFTVMPFINGWRITPINDGDWVRPMQKDLVYRVESRYRGVKCYSAVYTIDDPSLTHAYRYRLKEMVFDDEGGYVVVRMFEKVVGRPDEEDEELTANHILFEELINTVYIKER